MPSISDDSSRHVVIDSRPGHYICFPDVRRTGDGRLLCVYRQSDQHVASRADLQKSAARWAQPRLSARPKFDTAWPRTSG